MLEAFVKTNEINFESESIKKAEQVLKEALMERQGSRIYEEYGVPYILKWSLVQLAQCDALRPDRIAYVVNDCSDNKRF